MYHISVLPALSLSHPVLFHSQFYTLKSQPRPSHQGNSVHLCLIIPSHYVSLSLTLTCCQIVLQAPMKDFPTLFLGMISYFRPYLPLTYLSHRFPGKSLSLLSVTSSSALALTGICLPVSMAISHSAIMTPQFHVLL